MDSPTKKLDSNPLTKSENEIDKKMPKVQKRLSMEKKMVQRLGQRNLLF